MVRLTAPKVTHRVLACATLEVCGEFCLRPTAIIPQSQLSAEQIVARPLDVACFKHNGRSR